MDTKNTAQLRKIIRGCETNELNARGPLLVSKRQTAELLGVCLRTVDNLIANKELPCLRIGKRVLVKHSSLLAFIRRDHVGAPKQRAQQAAQ
jgi:excisionase family DNA binding protein